MTPENHPLLPLDGLVVVEQPASVSLRYCGRLLVEHGATVWQVGAPPVGDAGYGGAASEAYARWLDRGKRRAPLATVEPARVGLARRAAIAGVPHGRCTDLPDRRAVLHEQAAAVAQRDTRRLFDDYQAVQRQERVVLGCHGSSFSCAASRWQAAACVPGKCRQGGSSVRQTAIARGQRG